MPELPNTPGRPATRFRREIKYLVSESSARAIAGYLQRYVEPDRYTWGHPDGAYPVASLYLDSEDLRLFRASQDGLKNRFKLRIRSYIDDPEYPRFIEIKRRVNTWMVKSHVRVMVADIGPLLSGRDGRFEGGDEGAETLNQFMYYSRRFFVRPMLQVRYLRQAFESSDANFVRVTFDRDLCIKAAQNLELKLMAPGWQRVPLGEVILEFKISDHYPRWLQDLVRRFELRQQSVCKYGIGLQQAQRLGFCRPRLGQEFYNGSIVVAAGGAFGRRKNRFGGERAPSVVAGVCTGPGVRVGVLRDA